ncbi:GNAT family N-acetyltransferase [Embleya sp. NPDC005971]|uniref:GNAT family N-acetyltransferase n=1 Tax=Embleya sp. NPDC005971 TaxID=3156724 RepID=UPI0033DC0377
MELRHHRLDDLDQVRPILSAIYAEVHPADPDMPFRSVERFEQRLAGHASGNDWHAVIAYDQDRPVGFVYAAPLAPTSKWWSSMLTELPEGYVDETGRRTLALFEIMLLDTHRGRGLSHRLHEALLAARTEERVTLLVDPTHPSVARLYEEWGYKRVGDQQPFPDAPVFTVMVRELS